MRELIREQLAKEMTRKQFLQYMAGVMLMVFGLENIINLLLRPRAGQATAAGKIQMDNSEHGFGSRRFGK